MKDYKNKHPEIFDLGCLKGEELYERCFDRQNALTYAQKCCRFTLESEENAYIEGFFSGFEEAEKSNYKILTDLILEDEH